MSSADFQITDEDIDTTLEAVELLLMLDSRYSKEDVAEQKRRWVAEKARKQRIHEEQEAESNRREKQQQYNTAKRFALNLHSDFTPEITQARKEEEKGMVVGQFQEAVEAIKNREISYPTGGFKFNLLETRKAPKLMDLSLEVLANHCEAIMSLNLVPDHLRKKLTNHVGALGKTDARFMQLLSRDSPDEISASNCVNLEEKDLSKILSDCDRISLKVLNLDLCGPSMTEHMITDFLKRSRNGFPSLTTLSLQGAFSLTDNALALLSKSAPLLRFINLLDCSLLTSQAVTILADNFKNTLRGLNIGGCQGMKPSKDLKMSLEKFTALNYLSVAGLEWVNDVVIEFITTRGSNLTDLSLASCNNVSDEFIWTVGRYCSKLETLDISGLTNLTVASLVSIAEGCRSLNSVILTKAQFCDVAVAAFLQVSGSSLTHLCLNNVRDAGQNTAFSLGTFCKKLRYLDLSWCRKMSEKDLRRILSCCSSLKSLKLFGWTQVTNEFLEEVSRSCVHITGLKLTSLFAHLDDSFPSEDE